VIFHFTRIVFPVTIYGMDRVAEELGAINQTLSDIRDRMSTPESKVTKFLKAVVLLAGALGILHTAGLIWNWLMGS